MLGIVIASTLHGEGLDASKPCLSWCSELWIGSDPLNLALPTATCLAVLPMATDSIDGIEIPVQLMLIAPVQHAVMRHDFLETTFTDSALEAD